MQKAISVMSINRNIVECKASQSRHFFEQFTVLIETLWNVKMDINVTPSVMIRINRNIVECKDK